MTKKTATIPAYQGRFGSIQLLFVVVVLLLSLPQAVQSWIFPVPSPIKSLPVIEAPSVRETTIPSTATTITTATTPKNNSKRRKVFCDLDGVLVDFEYGVRQLLESDPNLDPNQPIPQLADMEKSQLWETVQSAPSFFQHLPWTREGPALWQALQHLEPHILTGIPRTHGSARQEKYEWCLQHLTMGQATASTSRRFLKHVDKACPYTLEHRERPSFSIRNYHQQQESTNMSSEAVCQIITCWSSNKHHESGPGHVLIDDRFELQEAWVRQGGIFIHHRPGDLAGTLQQLQSHGLLDESKTIPCHPSL